jgi:DNA gyrase subunit B
LQQLSEFAEETGRTLLEKIANASRTRISARSHKDLQRRKNALEMPSPAKLSDCRSDDANRTELFIVEGDIRTWY